MASDDVARSIPDAGGLSATGYSVEASSGRGSNAGGSGSAGARITMRQIGVVVAAIGLSAGIWIAILLAAETQAEGTRERAAAAAGNLAVALAGQLHQQLWSIDQSMRTLTAQWKDDPAHFDPTEFRTRSILMSDLGEQVIILDRDGRVTATTVPKLANIDLHERPYFQVPQTTAGVGLYTGPPILDRAIGRTVMHLARRLPDPDGNFVGVLVVTLDIGQLARLMSGVDLGPGGMMGLIGPGPTLRRLVGLDVGQPDGSIQGTEMLAAAQSIPDGEWIGLSALDGQERIHAFRRLGDQEPQVVVGIDLATAMANFLRWQREAMLFGAVITLLIAAITALLWRQLGEATRRHDISETQQARLAETHDELIDARTRADRRLSELRATVAATSDGVSMLDGELRLVLWNDHFSDYAGVPKEVLRVGLPMEEIIRAQARAGEFGTVDVEAEVARRMVLLRSRTQTDKIERNRPGGRVLELRRTPLPGGGFVTLYTDVTPRKVAQTAQLEARRIAETATETRSRFVAIVSHEIRTPLNSVLAALSLLADSGLQPAQLRLADRAREAGDALVHLLNDILEMSKMEGGRLSLRPSVFAVRPLLEGVMEMFRADAAESGIMLMLEMAPGAPERLMTDPGRLRQILMNLLSNAVKYTSPGTVMMLAETVVLNGRPALRLAVRDQGPHIPQPDAERLFQPFVRLENASGSRALGTGLGLTICQRLAELMGGQIGLAAAGGGNEFWVTIPMDAAPGQALASPSPVSPVPAAPRAATLQPAPAATPIRRRPPRTRILLVDDVPANQVITATMLRREGHQTDIAMSGRDAIAMVQLKPYDVVLMDVFMPGMNGLEAARRIRTLRGPIAAVPIIAVTANVSLEDRGACLEAGMNDMLAKPVHAEQLQDAMIRHVWPVHAVRLAAAAGTTRGPSQDGPRLDVGRIADLRNSLPAATFPSMVENCLSDLQLRMPELRRALYENAAAAAEQTAHAMVGVCGSYGLVGMRRRLGVVMQAARAGDMNGAMQASAGLEEELERTISAVRALLQPQAA